MNEVSLLLLEQVCIHSRDAMRQLDYICRRRSLSEVSVGGVHAVVVAAIVKGP